MICLGFVAAVGLPLLGAAGDYVILKMDVEGAEFHGAIFSSNPSSPKRNIEHERSTRASFLEEESVFNNFFYARFFFGLVNPISSPSVCAPSPWVFGRFGHRRFRFDILPCMAESPSGSLVDRPGAPGAPGVSSLVEENQMDYTGFL